MLEEQFQMLSGEYNMEQKALELNIPEKVARLKKLRASAANVDAFVEKSRRFATIDELTPEHRGGRAEQEILQRSHAEHPHYLP